MTLETLIAELTARLDPDTAKATVRYVPEIGRSHEIKQIDVRNFGTSIEIHLYD